MLESKCQVVLTSASCSYGLGSSGEARRWSGEDRVPLELGADVGNVVALGGGVISQSSALLRRLSE